MMKSPSGIPTRVRFATPYLEVESQSNSALERTIKRELAQPDKRPGRHAGLRGSVTTPPATRSSRAAQD
jgi:hypothetical protein